MRDTPSHWAPINEGKQNKTEEENNMTLKDTAQMMGSTDYKERFKAEYHQTKIRYEKLKKFNAKIEAAKRTQYFEDGKKLEMPAHDCPDDLLIDQQHTMGQYLHLLEVRAHIEGIDL